MFKYGFPAGGTGMRAMTAALQADRDGDNARLSICPMGAEQALASVP